YLEGGYRGAVRAHEVGAGPNCGRSIPALGAGKGTLGVMRSCLRSEREEAEMKTTFAIDHLVFEHYTGPEHTEAYHELWAACAACGRRMRVSRGVDSDALARVLAEDYAYGPYRHTCDEARWQ